MACKRCGHCCLYAKFTLPVAPDISRDMARWYQMHGCACVIKDDYIRVMIPYICQNLAFDPESNMSICKIYEDRPQICKDYLCKAANDSPKPQDGK